MPRTVRRFRATYPCRAGPGPACSNAGAHAMAESVDPGWLTVGYLRTTSSVEGSRPADRIAASS
jgi:hypothetical protein